MLLHHCSPTRTLPSTNQFFPCVSRFSTGFGKRSFSYLAPTVWNGLPLNIRLSPTFDTFKRHLKTHLFKYPINTHTMVPSASDSVFRVFCRFHDKARYWSKIATFSYLFHITATFENSCEYFRAIFQNKDRSMATTCKPIQEIVFYLCAVHVPQAQFSALCSLSCTQPHLVLLFHLFL